MIEVGGIKTKSHFFNRIAMLDHGKYYPLPLGLTSPLGKDSPIPFTKSNYGITLNTREQVGIAKFHFWQNDSIAEKIFDGCVKGIFSAGSIGARPIKATILPPDLPNGLPGGIHYLELELVEPTITAVPTNQEAVRDYLEMDAVGKSLPDFITKSLEPFADPKRAWTTGIGGFVTADFGVTKQMSASNSSTGGALVPPPGNPGQGNPTQKTSSPGGPAALDDQQAKKTLPERFCKQVLMKWNEIFSEDIQDLQYDMAILDHQPTRKNMNKVLKQLRAMQEATHMALQEVTHGLDTETDEEEPGEPFPTADDDEEEEELEEGEVANAEEEIAKELEGEKSFPTKEGGDESSDKEAKEKKPKKKKLPFAKSLTADDEAALAAKLELFFANQASLNEQKDKLDSRLAKIS